MDDFFIISSSNVFSKQKEKIDQNCFTTLSLIGKGAYGEVYLVKKKDNNKIFALKQLKKKKINLSKQKNHVKEERNILVLSIK